MNATLGLDFLGLVLSRPQVGSWLEICLRLLEMTGVNTSLFRIVRIAKVIGRVSRLLKLGGSLDGLQIIFDTVIFALPNLFYVAVIILLILFVYGTGMLTQGGQGGPLGLAIA